MLSGAGCLPLTVVANKITWELRPTTKPENDRQGTPQDQYPVSHVQGSWIFWRYIGRTHRYRNRYRPKKLSLYHFDPAYHPQISVLHQLPVELTNFDQPVVFNMFSNKKTCLLNELLATTHFGNNQRGWVKPHSFNQLHSFTVSAGFVQSSPRSMTGQDIFRFSYLHLRIIGF